MKEYWNTPDRTIASIGVIIGIFTLIVTWRVACNTSELKAINNQTSFLRYVDTIRVQGSLHQINDDYDQMISLCSDAKGFANDTSRQISFLFTINSLLNREERYEDILNDSFIVYQLNSFKRETNSYIVIIEKAVTDSMTLRFPCEGMFDAPPLKKGDTSAQHKREKQIEDCIQEIRNRQRKTSSDQFQSLRGNLEDFLLANFKDFLKKRFQEFRVTWMN